MLTQLRFEISDVNLAGVGVHQIGEIKTTGRGLQCRADKGADLSRRFVRLVLHSAHKTLHIVRVTLHLPGHVRLDNDAQTVARADILQTAGGGAQPQINRDRRFERRRPTPPQTGFKQDPRRIAETGNHRRFTRAHLHQARGRHRNRHQQRGPPHASPRERAGLLWIAVMMVMTVVVMPAMAVIVATVVIMIVGMRLAQWATPG